MDYSLIDYVFFGYIFFKACRFPAHCSHIFVVSFIKEGLARNMCLALVALVHVREQCILAVNGVCWREHVVIVVVTVLVRCRMASEDVVTSASRAFLPSVIALLEVACDVGRHSRSSFTPPHQENCVRQILGRR